MTSAKLLFVSGSRLPFYRNDLPSTLQSLDDDLQGDAPQVKRYCVSEAEADNEPIGMHK